MDLYPAIDLRDGRCVRLYQGDYDRETVYGDDPVAQALAFEAEGAAWLHVVDLDAARTGEATNRPIVGAIAEALSIPVQTGGGVRTAEAANALFDLGVERVVIGTAAIENPLLVETLAANHRVAVGLDARGRDIAVHGWETSSGKDLYETARSFAGMGVDAFVVTEIGRDGTLEGPDVDGLTAMLDATDVDVIASGGVGTIADLLALADVSVGEKSISGSITGRAIYEGRFTVAEALTALKTTPV